MTTAEQRSANLARGDRKRIEGARQRRELVGAPMHRVIPALIHPTPELATKKLATLFTPGHNTTGLIPRVGKHALNLAFLDLLQRYPRGRHWWHSQLRLGDLSELERRRLVNALVMRAPKSWRTATAEDPKGEPTAGRPANPPFAEPLDDD